MPEPSESGGRTRSATIWTALIEILSSCSHSLRDAVALCALRASLTEPQFTLLWACGAEGEGLSQRELAERLSLSTAHVSGLVEQLSERALIVGQRARHDRRRQIWHLTATGRDVVEQIIADLEPWTMQLEARLPRGARERLTSALHELATGLSSMGRGEVGSELPSNCAGRLPRLDVSVSPATSTTGGLA